uniref:CIA30 family protein n=1 Tax=Daejeonella sp. TaxID=2805397 RepID=UPI00404B190F
MFVQTNPNEIYKFTTLTKVNEWRIVNDGVMGGISKSSLILNDLGNGQFMGHVSLANNGGFASIQLNKTIKLADKIKFILLRIKGDGKAYEFRLKSQIYGQESYVYPFMTTEEWEIIKLPISEFYPQVFGRKLNRSNFNFKRIEQLSFLIANKQEEDFKLLIDWIGLE